MGKTKILIVEGATSRSGVGNDLFDQAYLSNVLSALLIVLIRMWMLLSQQFVSMRIIILYSSCWAQRLKY